MPSAIMLSVMAPHLALDETAADTITIDEMPTWVQINAEFYLTSSEVKKFVTVSKFGGDGWLA